MKRALLLALIALTVCGCPEDDDGGSNKTVIAPLPVASVIGPATGTTAAADGGVPVAVVVDGVALYQRYQVTGSGLGGTPTAMPCREVVIEVVAHDDINDVIAAGFTDISGDYSISFNTTQDYYVRARARTVLDRVRHSATLPATVWAVTSQIHNRINGNQTVNLLASASLPVNTGGAFAILDTLHSLREASAASQICEAYWAPGNIGSQFQKDANGDPIEVSTKTVRNGPSGFVVLFFVGGDPVDSFASDHDEYDVGVIAHEWAHWYMMTESRDNNPQGPHAGEDIIPSAAYAEGLATTLGPALLGLSLYRDTTGYPGGSPSIQFEFDLESGINPGSGNGYTGEFNVARVAFDLMDDGTNFPSDTDADGVAIARADFLSALRDMQSRPAPYEVAWLASLLQQLIDDGHLTVMQANTLMTAQGAAFPPAGGVDPFPTELTVGGPTDTLVLDAWAGGDPNPTLSPSANGTWRFTLGGSQSVTVNLTNNAGSYNSDNQRVDVIVYDLGGNVVAESTGTAKDKSVTELLPSGTFIVRLWHRPKSQGASQATSVTVGVQ